MPTGWRSTYRVVTSKTVPKMDSLTKSAMLGEVMRWVRLWLKRYVAREEWVARLTKRTRLELMMVGD